MKILLVISSILIVRISFACSCSSLYKNDFDYLRGLNYVFTARIIKKDSETVYVELVKDYKSGAPKYVKLFKGNRVVGCQYGPTYFKNNELYLFGLHSPLNDKGELKIPICGGFHRPASDSLEYIWWLDEGMPSIKWMQKNRPI